MAKHEQQAYERLGAKVLALPDVIAQSVGFMGPVFSSAFVIPLVVSAVIAIAITAGAIFGSFYKVTSPTIYAPWIALAVLVIGFASTFVTRARRSASSELSDLTKSTA
jgi:membrane-associated HD superfamily phosphohydrolase